MMRTSDGMELTMTDTTRQTINTKSNRFKMGMCILLPGNMLVVLYVSL